MKMNQPKNVQKSIRISEDVLKYIEKQEGNGFNEKLCNMVLYCMEHEADRKKKVSAAEKRLEVVEKQIGEKEELLEKLESISRFVGSCLRVIQ